MDSCPHFLSDDEMVLFWFDSADLSQNTRRTYLSGIRYYVNFTGKMPVELIEEAEEEIRAGKLMRERSIKRHLVSFRVSLQESGTAPNTIRSYLAAVRSFYENYDIDIPKKISNRRQSGQIILEKNKRTAPKDEIREVLNFTNPRSRAFILSQCNSGLSLIDLLNLKIHTF